MEKIINNDINTSKLIAHNLQKHAQEVFDTNLKYSETEQVNITYYEKQKMIAGLVGYNYIDYFHIDLLWVAAEQRGKRLGTKLIEDVKNLKDKYKIRHIHLETMSFQALNFYLKLGFEIFGKIEDEEKTMYFLKLEI